MGLRVIIPAAGVGTRLRPHTHTAPKAMLYVAGKPMLGHILDELKNYDVDEVTLIVGHMGDTIRNYVLNEYNFKFQFVTQSVLKGLGHAIWLTSELYRNTSDPLIIVLGDTIFDVDFKSVFSGGNWIGIKEIDNPSRFGVVELNADGNICKMVEKPENPSSNLAIVGIYAIDQALQLYECLDQLIQQGRMTRGEYQLTDALQMMIDNGSQIKPLKVNEWFDCGKPESLLETNRMLLTRLLLNQPEYEEPFITGSAIRNPVSLGKNVMIDNSVIGPFVTIADNVIIRNSIIKNSIVSNGARVTNVILNDSIIADYAKVSGRAYRLNVGDSSEIDMD